MTIDSYQNKAYVAIQDHVDKKDAILNWAVGLSEECGEIQGLIKHEMWADEKPSKEEYAKEIGDVLWYLSALSTELGLDLSIVAQMNLCKLKKRHGDAFNIEGSRDRHEIEKRMEEDKEWEFYLSHLERGN